MTIKMKLKRINLKSQKMYFLNYWGNDGRHGRNLSIEQIFYYNQSHAQRILRYWFCAYRIG